MSESFYDDLSFVADDAAQGNFVTNNPKLSTHETCLKPSTSLSALWPRSCVKTKPPLQCTY